jgi:outer membrane lipoprotein-sorting protein
MRKILVIAALLASSLLQAQSDKRATAILDAMSNKYKTMTSFKVAFTYTNEGRQRNEV